MAAFYAGENAFSDVPSRGKWSGACSRPDRPRKQRHRRQHRGNLRHTYPLISSIAFDILALDAKDLRVCCCRSTRPARPPAGGDQTVAARICALGLALNFSSASDPKEAAVKLPLSFFCVYDASPFHPRSRGARPTRLRTASLISAPVGTPILCRIRAALIGVRSATYIVAPGAARIVSTVPASCILSSTIVTVTPG